MSTSKDSTSHVRSLVSKFSFNDPDAQNVDKIIFPTSKIKLIEPIPQDNIYTMPCQHTSTCSANEVQNKTNKSNPKNQGKNITPKPKVLLPTNTELTTLTSSKAEQHSTLNSNESICDDNRVIQTAKLSPHSKIPHVIGNNTRYRNNEKV